MEKLKKVYRDRLLKLADTVEADYEHFYMGSWCFVDTNASDELWEAVHSITPHFGFPEREKVVEALDLLQVEGKDNKPYCGTYLCLAGHACFINKDQVAKESDALFDWPQEATRILGLEGTRAATRLWYVGRWPQWAKKRRKETSERCKTGKGFNRADARIAALMLRMLAEGKDPWEGEL